MRIPLSLAQEVCDAADRVLRARQHLIADGQLDGKMWAATCYANGIEMVRRRRQATRRRGAA